LITVGRFMTTRRLINVVFDGLRAGS